MSLPIKELSDAELATLAEGERRRVVAPLTEWHTLAAALRDEGILHGVTQPDVSGAGHGSVMVPRRNGIYRWGTRAVTGFALLAIGVVLGRGWTFGANAIPEITRAIQQADSASAPKVFKTPQQAKAVLAQSQNDYQRAAAYLIATDTGARLVGGPEAYQERLAALDAMVRVGQRVLKDAPHDPVINQYYLSTVGMRQATLEQLRDVLPVNVHVIQY